MCRSGSAVSTPCRAQHACSNRRRPARSAGCLPPLPRRRAGRVRAKGGPDSACSVEGCKRPYRAKGYCYFHFKKWRQGELPHSRYRTCSKAECRQKAVRHGLCEKHGAETHGSQGRRDGRLTALR